MGSTKFDIEKFSGSNDFGLWRIKMQAVLVQQGLGDTLKGEAALRNTLTAAERKDLIDKARSIIILCLGDKPLREVAREPTAAALWLKLESLYMTKSVANRLFLKQQLFSFKMSEDKPIAEQIADYNKILDDLENLEVKMDDEDKALILLSALPSSYEHFKDAILFGRDQTITLDEVQSSIRTKEFQKKQKAKTENNAESLNIVRGRHERRNGKQGKHRSKSRNQDKSKYKCFHCHKKGHFKKECPERKNKGPKSSQSSGDAAIVSSGYESSGYESIEALVLANTESEKDWVLDSGCTYHMCPRKDYFESLTLQDAGVVLLGNNKPCRVQGQGSIRLKMFNGQEIIVSGVRDDASGRIRREYNIPKDCDSYED